MKEKTNIISMDGLMRISLMGGMARAFLADTTRLVEKARGIHGMSGLATAALGRLMTGAVMMGAMLKNQGDSLTAQVKGGGPIGTVLAVAGPDGSVKGYVDHPRVELPLKNGKLDVGGAVGTQGELAVIKDMGLREPYIGRVPLSSGEIAEDLAYYFTASEQTPSVVSLGVLTGDTVFASGGLIIQPMPGCDEVALKSIELSAPMFENISYTIYEYGLEGAVNQLMLHLEPEIISHTVPAFRCDCSRSRMERVLISLGEAELLDMIAEQHGAELTCHFCHSKYYFTEKELGELIERAKA